MSQLTVLRSDVIILKQDHAKAFQALKDLAAQRPLTWVRMDEILKAKTLEAALTACRWHPVTDQNGHVHDLDFLGEKLGDEDQIFQAIGPFIQPGLIDVVSDDGERWRWRFTGTSCIRQTAVIRWEPHWEVDG